MKLDSKINYFFILTFIAGLIVGALVFSSCTKDKLSDYACDGMVIRSSLGYVPDTTKYQILKFGVSNEDILWFQNNRNYSMMQIQNGVLVTTISTMVCKNVTCIEIK